MSAALRSRLERPEVRAERKKPLLFRSGYLKFEWCEFEERPGQASGSEDPCFTVYLTENAQRV
jgi:hypothetical protein